MTKREKDRFLADRAEALATVILTRRKDLVVTEAEDSTGLDLHVKIVRKGQPMRSQFGVLLRGTFAPLAHPESSRVVNRTVARFQSLEGYPYPVCLFVFTMQDDQAFYAWLAEPVVTPDGRPRLPHANEIDCRPLDNDGLEQIVTRVGDWYDAFHAEVVATGDAPTLH